MLTQTGHLPIAAGEVAPAIERIARYRTLQDAEPQEAEIFALHRYFVAAFTLLSLLPALVCGQEVKRATREQAAALLQQDDDFTAGLSRFDLQVRLQTNANVTVADLKQRIGESTLEWTAEEAEKTDATLTKLRPKLEKFRLPWPEVIWLAKTNGREDADSAYTRGTTIVLPERVLRQKDDSFERLMVHEMFHALSRNSREFRENMYAVIGFKLCEDIPLPQSLSKRKISNPDAPRFDCYQILRQGDEKFAVTPVIYSRNDFDPRTGGNLFKSLEFKLMRLEETTEGFRPAEKSGQLLLDPKDVADFHAQIGRNTGYIIHPDEVLADNFVHLVLGAADLKSPEIVEGMRNVVRVPEEK